MAAKGQKRNKKGGKRREADFTAAEINLLRRFAGAQCSNPTCENKTDAKRSDADKVLNLGVAAHIHAAQPGWARYKPDQPPEERASALKNGIWLCIRCAKRIDDEKDGHPADLLFAWRHQREQIQHEEVARGKRHTAERARETLAGTYAQLAFLVAFGLTIGVGWWTLALSMTATVSYSFVLYYRIRSAKLSRELEALAEGSTVVAVSGAATWTWKRLLADLPVVVAFLVTIGIGVGRLSKSLRASPVPDVRETVEIENLPVVPAPPPPPTPPPEPMGAAGPPQQIRLMSDGREDDPNRFSPILDGANQEFVGDPGPPKRMWVGRMQPTHNPGFLGMMVFRNLELRALKSEASMLGGVPDGSDREPAPIKIVDSFLDNRIKLGENVYLENVQRKDF